MRKPLHQSRSILSKSRWSLCFAGTLFSAIGVLFWLAFRSSVNPSPAAPDTLLDAKMHIQGIYAALCSYRQTHDAKSLERVKDEGKQVSELVAKLSAQLTQDGNKEAAANLQLAHQSLRDASVNLLEAELETTLARKSLAMATQTLDASLELLVQRSRRKIDLPRAQIEEYKQQASTVQRAESQAQQAYERFVSRKESLEKALGAGQQVTEASPRAILYPILMTFLLFGAGGLAFMAHVRTRTEIAKPLVDILQSVEAASTGDLSRVPDHWASDEVGRLSQAVGRLIQVLARSENLVYHLAALVESSGDAIISHNLEGKILSWNKGAQRLYGYSAEEVKGSPIEILTDGVGKTEMILNLMRLRKGERIMPFETVHQAKNGRSVRAFVRVAPILDSTKQVIGASFIAQELTAASPHPIKASSSRIP